MAKAQKEDGYLCLANALSEEFAARGFSTAQHAILRVVERRTYGYRGAKFAQLSSGQIAEATGLDASNIRKGLSALLAARVLLKNDEGIGFNTNLDEWKIARRARGGSTRPPGVDLPDPPGWIYPGPGVIQPAHPGGSTPATRVDPPRANDGNEPGGAAFEAPKDMKDMKDSLKDMAMQGLAGGQPNDRPVFSKMVEAIEWGEGEQDFWLEVFGYARQSDLALLTGESREKFRELLRFAPGSRVKAIAYSKAVAAKGTTVNRPLNFVLGYLQDPMRFPPLDPKIVVLGGRQEARAAEQTKPVDPREKYAW